MESAPHKKCASCWEGFGSKTFAKHQFHISFKTEPIAENCVEQEFVRGQQFPASRLSEPSASATAELLLTDGLAWILGLCFIT